MPLANDLTSFFDKNQARARDQLFDLLRIPSVSARSEHNADTARAAEWVAESLRGVGLTANVHATTGHPIVVGEWRGARRARRRCSSTATTTCSRPSRSSCGTARRSSRRCATARSSRAARSTTKASSSCTSRRSRRTSPARGKLPVNVIVLAEGEEEVGSDHLARVHRGARQGAARCDAVVISDSAMFAPGLAVASCRRCAASRISRSTCAVRRGSALGQLRRRRDESGDGARAHSRHDARRRAATSRSPVSTTTCATGAHVRDADEAAAVRREGISAKRRGRRRCSARRATRRSSGCGCGRPAR